jgi:uncharacterized membrane protein HdeD (DUF308 family)
MSDPTDPIPTAPTPKEAHMQTPTRSQPQRPPFDPAALVAGIVFIVIAVLALLDPEVARRVDLAVVWSAAFVTVGAALLLTTFARRGPVRQAEDV